MNIYLKVLNDSYYLSIGDFIVNMKDERLLGEAISYLYSQSDNDDEIYIVTNDIEQTYEKQETIKQTIESVCEFPVLEVRQPVEIFEFETLDKLDKYAESMVSLYI